MAQECTCGSCGRCKIRRREARTGSVRKAAVAVQEHVKRNPKTYGVVAVAILAVGGWKLWAIHKGVTMAVAGTKLLAKASLFGSLFA